MLANGEEGHIVNTASIAGLLTAANPYNVSKHGVVCLTEGMSLDFREMGAKLSASVVCPGLINTRILEAERNRPDAFGEPTDIGALRPDLQRFAAGFEAALRGGYGPDVVADHVLEGIIEDRFYILPAQPEILDRVDARFQGLIERRNPSPR
jgi:NAD(P)-dependent dehydrogenase (short-subunit alcohol dehydrogenase family)